MLRAMRALLYKLLCISVICKFFTRLKRVLGVRSSPSSDDILPTSGGGDLLKDDDDDVDETGDWGSWDSSAPLSIEVTGQRAVPQERLYSSKARTPVEPEPPQPDPDFFGDMEPVIEKPNQKLRVKQRGAQSGMSGHAAGSRFAFQEPGTSAELETWDDAEPASAWDEEVLDDNEAEAISAEAKKQKREADRQRRQQERDQRRVQQEQKRQEQLQRKQLGMKIP